MITSTYSKLMIFFFLTLLFSLLFQIFIDFYNFHFYISLSNLIPGIIAIVLMFGYEEPGVGQGMLARRIIPTKKTTLGGVLIAFLPLLIFPVAFFLFYFIYKPNTEPFVINWYVLLFPIIGAFSVELGWRGYFLNKAGSTMHIFLATIFTGILWFLSNAYLYINDVFLGITYMFLSVIINIILTYLYFIFNRNILLTYFFQLAYTYMYLYFTMLVPKDERFVFLLLLLFTIPAAFILLKNKALFQIDKENDI